MRKLTAILLILLSIFSGNVFSKSEERLNISESDDAPTLYPYRIEFPTGWVTDNLDGTASVADIFNGDAGASYDDDTDVATFGSASIGGTGEYVQGTRAGIDLDDGGVGRLRFYARAGTNNEKLDLDLESTANKAIWSTPTSVAEEVHPWILTANKFISGGGTSSSYDINSATTSFYKMEDNAANGTLVDAQAALHNGTCTSNTSVMTTTGKINNGLQINESNNQECDLGNTSDFKFAGDFAVAFWMNHTLSSTSKRIMGNRLGSSTNTGIEITHVGSTLKTQFVVDIGASSVQLNSTTATNTGAWFFVVVQRASGSCELYINGTLEAGPSTCTGTLAAAGNFYFGGTPLNRSEYTGKLDNPMILGARSLTTTEITFLHASGTGTDSLSGGVTPTKVIPADDAAPDVSSGEIFITSANVGATAITDLTNPTVGQSVCIIGGATGGGGASTIADSGNFNLSASFTANPDDVLCLYVQADNDYIEMGRVNN